MSIQKQKDKKLLEHKALDMPWFVQQFIDYKFPDVSPSTLLEYIRDYQTFFAWLIQEGLTEATQIKEVTLENLEKLRMNDITNYRIYLTNYKSEVNQKITVSRKLSSLRSLFHYLSQIAEDEEYYPLLKRNIMAKVEIKRLHKPKDSAKKLEGKILQEEEIQDFLSYLRFGYYTDIENNKQASYNFKKNQVRDLCIVSLILHSGLRVSELINLNTDDIDLNMKLVYVYRKGNQDETYKTPVYFREDAKQDLIAYLEIRELRYLAPKKEKALFLSVPNGKKEGQRLSKRAIQQMIIKYAKSFGKPFLTVHKLRHSFATDYYLQNDIYQTKEQLGHASTETTEIYAHLTDKTMAKAIDRRKKEEK